ncbi:hypothetical protein CONLIGDRAFT_460376 [Coniochaeta ligniaria NRRL 30616]|uniref:Uncharacterized protein n=1 Tax=Coniochaeta ligniaria NRRL 30616 TaxID=1408157 RepID=A0A1J7J451_9PEZI|nr:hypothetical protein CONLIGDRAFT_460376 [Coniochaeta ligniaria NRRL 30616]
MLRPVPGPLSQRYLSTTHRDDNPLVLSPLVLWLNGRASDYESGGCRFDPCQDHILLRGVVGHDSLMSDKTFCAGHRQSHALRHHSCRSVNMPFRCFYIYVFIAMRTIEGLPNVF